jgi:hypothetical protein
MRRLRGGGEEVKGRGGDKEYDVTGSGRGRRGR